MALRIINKLINDDRAIRAKGENGLVKKKDLKMSFFVRRDLIPHKNRLPALSDAPDLPGSFEFDLAPGRRYDPDFFRHRGNRRRHRHPRRHLRKNGRSGKS